ncbi:MAG: replicative DNA helicase [Deltaproteobacteria bacterium]|nr:replicative DNA helicase [Deltaproteobacteria bacterium]
MPEFREKTHVPHSAEAEKAVLGTILAAAGENLSGLLGMAALQAEYFYLNEHRLIYQVLLDMDEHGQAADLISVHEKLIRRGFDNFAYANALVESAPLTLNIEHYAEIVRKNFYLRKVIETCQKTMRLAMTTDGEISDFVGQVEKEFLEIANAQDRSEGLISAPVAVTRTLGTIEQRLGHEGDITGLTSGFTDLDSFTGGWQKSDLIILAARPGMGKTALALNFLVNGVLSSDKVHAAIFSLEMSGEQLMERLLSARGRLDSVKLRKGNLLEDEQGKLLDAARSLHGLGNRLMIDDTPGLSMFDLRSRCRRYRKEHGLNLVIIDYLQLMTGSPQARKQGREREISEISMGLKALAKELAVPVVALAQLNRGPDARPDKKPKISDLRESGSMEQDADQIMFVYRDEYYNPDSELAGKAEVILAKNRHGEVGSCFLAWQPNYVTFFNLQKDEFSG